MKKISIAAAILVLSISFFQTAEAHDRDLDRVIVGATVGGVIGLIVGSEVNRHHVVVNTYQPAYRHHRHYYRGWNRSYYRPEQRCERIIKVRKGRHFERRVVKTVCRDRSRFYHHEDRPRGHYRWYR